MIPVLDRGEAVLSPVMENLVSVLQNEVHLYRDLLDLLQREKRCMMDLALDNIHECNNLKETLILKLRVLEESRIELIQDIASASGLENPVTLGRIIEVAPPIYGKPLESCRSNLVSLLSSVREVVQINAVLAERSIHYTRDSLSFLNRLTHTMPVYLSSGQMGTRPGHGRLVSRKG
ncbi:MAG: flagellar protein FlgN [Nitrospirae bacterium]|nr:flagellar protein FlgN [Nitrospirota bacterium]